MDQVSEVSILDEGGIKITDKRAIFGSRTYAMANITSVGMAYSDKPGGMMPIIIATLASSIGFCALLFSFGEDGMRWGLFFVGAIIALTGIGVGALIYNSSKRTYYVRVGGPTGETNVLQSNNKAQIARIVQAINKVIVSRG